MTLIHISKAPDCETGKEEKQLASLDRYQKRYLKRFVCALCDHPLEMSGCGGFLENDWSTGACSEKKRIDRRNDCLSKYRPRIKRRK